MTPEQHLREAISQERARVGAQVPGNRAEAIVAILRARDDLPLSFRFDLVSGRRFPDLGANLALQFCLESAPTEDSNRHPDLERWSAQFLEDCTCIAEVELVLAHCESGFMRMVEDKEGEFHAWIASKRLPASWREREGIDEWESLLARESDLDLKSLARVDEDAADQLAATYVERLSYQLGYPSDSTIAGCSVRTILGVLELMLGRAIQERVRGEPATARLESTLIDSLSVALGADPEQVADIVSAFTLDSINAAFHAEVPGIAAAPSIRLDEARLIWSFRGLTSEPLLFLTRELRRRSGQEYHNAAHLRENVFRDDVNRLFLDKRFVTSTSRVELRRNQGDLRTDVDAIVFDRKTGTLGLFELKSQDPFSRSNAELIRRRDNMMHANRQVSGILDWLKRHGGDDLLGRVDRATAKRFRVHNVYPFVLGRYLARFNDGPEPDHRAAWGTWPQVLRLLDGFAVNASEANPVASLFARLQRDSNAEMSLEDIESRQITLGATRLTVYPSHAALNKNREH